MHGTMKFAAAVALSLSATSQTASATEHKLLSACFVMEPEFDPSWANHTIADKFIVNDCIMKSYNKLMAPKYEITALGYWDEVTVEEYIDDIVTASGVSETEGSLRHRDLRRKKKMKRAKAANGGSAKKKCDSACGDDYYVPPASSHLARRLTTDDSDFGLEVQVCLLEAKLDEYLQAYDISNGVTLTTCEEEYIEDA